MLRLSNKQKEFDFIDDFEKKFRKQSEKLDWNPRTLWRFLRLSPDYRASYASFFNACVEASDSSSMKLVSILSNSNNPTALFNDRLLKRSFAKDLAKKRKPGLRRVGRAAMSKTKKIKHANYANQPFNVFKYSSYDSFNRICDEIAEEDGIDALTLTSSRHFQDFSESWGKSLRFPLDPDCDPSDETLWVAWTYFPAQVLSFNKGSNKIARVEIEIDFDFQKTRIATHVNTILSALITAHGSHSGTNLRFKPVQVESQLEALKIKYEGQKVGLGPSGVAKEMYDRDDPISDEVVTVSRYLKRAKEVIDLLKGPNQLNPNT